MSFSLEFSPEFFFAEGEPYDRSDLALNVNGEPTSVYSALCQLRDTDPVQWDELAQKLFEAPGSYLQPDDAISMAQETDTCSGLSSPVEVWIDADGDFRVFVHDSEES